MEVVVRGLFAANKYVNDEAWKMKDDPRRLAVVRTILEVIYAACHFLACSSAPPPRLLRLGTPPRPIRELRTRSTPTPGRRRRRATCFEKVKLGAGLEAAKTAEEAAQKAAETKQRRQPPRAPTSPVPLLRRQGAKCKARGGGGDAVHRGD